MFDCTALVATLQSLAPAHALLNLITLMAFTGLQGHQRRRAGCCRQSADVKHTSGATGLAQGWSQFAQSLFTISLSLPAKPIVVQDLLAGRLICFATCRRWRFSSLSATTEMLSNFMAHAPSATRLCWFWSTWRYRKHCCCETHLCSCLSWV